jgi:hypothetical protein
MRLRVTARVLQNSVGHDQAITLPPALPAPKRNFHSARRSQIGLARGAQSRQRSPPPEPRVRQRRSRPASMSTQAPEGGKGGGQGRVREGRGETFGP